MSSLYQVESLGYDAYLDLKDKSENPYPVDTEEHEAWNIGWQNAYDDDGLDDDDYYDEDDDLYDDDFYEDEDDDIY